MTTTASAIDELRKQLADERAALVRGEGSSVVVEELEVQVARAERVVELEREAAAERQQVQHAEAFRVRRQAARERMSQAVARADAARREATTLFGRIAELEAAHAEAATEWRRAAQEAGDEGASPRWPAGWQQALQLVLPTLRPRETPDQQMEREQVLQEKLRERHAEELKRREAQAKQWKVRT